MPFGRRTSNGCCGAAESAFAAASMTEQVQAYLLLHARAVFITLDPGLPHPAAKLAGNDDVFTRLSAWSLSSLIGLSSMGALLRRLIHVDNPVVNRQEHG